MKRMLNPVTLSLKCFKVTVLCGAVLSLLGCVSATVPASARKIYSEFLVARPWLFSAKEIMKHGRNGNQFVRCVATI